MIQPKGKTKSAAQFISALGYYSSIDFTKDKKLASCCDCRPPNNPMLMITPSRLFRIHTRTHAQKDFGYFENRCLEDMNKYFDVLPICYYNSYAAIMFQDSTCLNTQDMQESHNNNSQNSWKQGANLIQYCFSEQRT